MTRIVVAVAVNSQGKIVSHAGRALTWKVYDLWPAALPLLAYTLQLEDHASLHEWHTADYPERHPLHNVDVAIAGSGGEGVHRQLAQRGTKLVTTSEKDALKAVQAFLNNVLPEALPHDESACEKESHRLLQQ